MPKLLKLQSLALMVTIAAVLATKPAFSQSVAGFGPPAGSEHCENWNKADSLGALNIITSYVYGYISAAAVYSSKDNMRGLNGGDIADYISRYCRAHPEDTIIRMAEQLFQTRAGRQ